MCVFRYCDRCNLRRKTLKCHGPMIAEGPCEYAWNSKRKIAYSVSFVVHCISDLKEITDRLDHIICTWFDPIETNFGVRLNAVDHAGKIRLANLMREIATWNGITELMCDLRTHKKYKLCNMCGLEAHKKCTCGTRYCSTNCQKVDWKIHKSICEETQHTMSTRSRMSDM